MALPWRASAQDAPRGEGAARWGAPVANVWTRFELRRGYDELAVQGPARLARDQDAFYYRAAFGFVTRPLEVTDHLAVSLKVLPQSSGVWQAGGDTLTNASLDLQEGYFSLHVGEDCFRLDLGRKEIAYGDHLVIGSVPWHQTGRTFDGAFGRFTLREGAYVDAFFTVLLEGLNRSEVAPSSAFGSGDGYFTGVYAGLGPLLGDGLVLDAYALSLIAPRFDDGAGTRTDTALTQTFGALFKGTFGRVFTRAEAGVQTGIAAAGGNVFAYQVDAEVGAIVGDARLSLHGLYASGDDDPSDADVRAWNQLFPTAHKFLGVSDIIGARSNVASLVAHARLPVADHFKLLLDAHAFFRPEPSAAGETGYAGAEVDASLRWRVAGGLFAWASYALFLPNGDFYANDTVAHFAELWFGYQLGPRYD